MKQMMEEAKKWFVEIDSKPEMYYVYSGNDKNLVNQDGENKLSNEEQIKKFEESQSNHLKLLFSIDMLNEGLHVENISGVIMLRSTDSRIIYLQQLGRALFTIRQLLIKPYLELKTEEEKTKYREEHLELEEVLQIVTEIDLNSGNKNRQELALLIRQDEEARKKVEEARKLEAQYEQQQKGQGIDTGENDGKQ